MLPKILITVKGGLVQHIATNMPAEIILIDYDNIDDGDYNDGEISAHEPDLIADEAWFQSEINKANDKIKFKLDDE